MSAPNPPARSTPQLDMLRRLWVRDSQYNEFGVGAFLESDERHHIDLLLEAAVEHGLVDKVNRRAHALLVQIGARDNVAGFLEDDERQRLVALTSIEPPSISGAKPGKGKERRPEGMSTGEALTAIGVVLSVAAAVFLVYRNPTTSDSAFWVGVWGLLFGSSFIGDTRRRSSKAEAGSISAMEGFLAMVIWGIAAAAVVLFGVHILTPGSAAFWCFIGAGILGRAVLKVKEDDDWSKWDDD